MVEQSILEMIGMASMSPSIKKLTDDTSKAKAMHKRIAGILVSRMPVKLHEMNEINRFLLDDANLYSTVRKLRGLLLRMKLLTL
jgi:hypothetical protein